MRYYFFITICFLRVLTQLLWNYLPDGEIVYYAGQAFFETTCLFIILSFIQREHYIPFLLTMFFAILSGFDFVKIIFFDPFNVSIMQYLGLVSATGVVIVIEIINSLRK